MTDRRTEQRTHEAITNTLLKTFLAALNLLVRLLMTGDLQAATPAHLERQASDFRHEVDDHFRNSPLYRELERDAVQIERLAAHLHQVVDHGANPNHLWADLDQLDGLVHHVEGLIDQMARIRQIDPRTLAHLRQTLSLIDGTVHHLQGDVMGTDGHEGHNHR